MIHIHRAVGPTVLVIPRVIELDALLLNLVTCQRVFDAKFVLVEAVRWGVPRVPAPYPNPRNIN